MNHKEYMKKEKSIKELAKEQGIELDPSLLRDYPIGTLFWFLHHSVALELLNEPLENRIRYILQHKPSDERKTRLSALRPVLDVNKLPLRVQAAYAEYTKAYAEYTKACEEYTKARDKYTKAYAEYTKACEEYTKEILARYDTEYTKEILARYDTEYPNHPKVVRGAIC